MSFPFKKLPGRAIDPEGRRLIGFTFEDREPIFAPKGHSSTYAANGTGKTTCIGVPGLLSLASSEPRKAIFMFDSKEEIAAQVANMLDKQGRKVAVIDDMGVHPEFAHLRVNLNPFGAAVATYRHDQRDLVFALNTIVNALIPEPAGGDAKNKWFRDVPRDINRFGIAVLLKNSTALATPGSLSDILCDPAMLKGFAEIEATEGHLMLQALARTVLEAASHESWPQHVSEARRSLDLFSPGTRLHDAGINASISHEDLIREGYIIFLVGPQRFMNSLGPYYALHILAFCDALYNGAGALRILADEFTNSPLASMVSDVSTHGTDLWI